VNESITGILFDLEQGIKNKHEAKAALKAIWLVCSGLIDRQLMDALAAVINQLPDRKLDTSFFLLSGKPIAAVIRAKGSLETYTVCTENGAKAFKFSTPEIANKAYNDTIAALTKTYQRCG
jgi:hypothetical protein